MTSGCSRGRPTHPDEAADSVLRAFSDVGIELTGSELARVMIARG